MLVRPLNPATNQSQSQKDKIQEKRYCLVMMRKMNGPTMTGKLAPRKARHQSIMSATRMDTMKASGRASQKASTKDYSTQATMPHGCEEEQKPSAYNRAGPPALFFN